MAEDKRIPITISKRATADIEVIAYYLGMPVSKLVGQWVDTQHQSPEFIKLLRRAKDGCEAQRLVENAIAILSPLDLDPPDQSRVDQTLNKLKRVQSLLKLPKE